MAWMGAVAALQSEIAPELLMTMMENVELQARFLADDNRKAEPSIQKVYWFPHADARCFR